jgi:hypothetical protein
MCMQLKGSCRRRSSRCEIAYGTERRRLFSRNVRSKTYIQSFLKGCPPSAREREPGARGRIFRYKYQHSHVFEPIVGDIMWISFAAHRYFEVKEFDRSEHKNPHDKASLCTTKLDIPVP